jgi:hypothetical protein
MNCITKNKRLREKKGERKEKKKLSDSREFNNSDKKLDKNQ